MNINATMKVSINSGAALILFLVAFFLLLGFTAMFPAVEKNFVAALTGLAGALGGFLVKRNSNNKINLEAEKAGVSETAEDGAGDPA
jgi:hypothetical protein